MNNSQLCFLIGNLWLLATTYVPAEPADAANSLLVVAGVFFFLSFLMSDWFNKPKPKGEEKDNHSVTNGSNP